MMPTRATWRAGLLAAGCVLAAPRVRAVNLRHLPPLRTKGQADATVQALSGSEARHASDLDQLDGMLADYRRLGRLDGGLDPGNALVRRRASAAVFWQVMDDAQRRCDEEMRYIDAVNLAAVSHALAGAPGAGPMPFLPDVVAQTGYEIRHTELCRRNDELIAAMTTEAKNDPALESEAAAARERRRLLRDAPWALVAAAVAAGLAWRRRPRAMPRRPAPRLLVADRFEVGQLQARGGAGETYLAVDRALQREVALRKLRPELAADPGALDRFVALTRAVAAVRHPNLLRTYSVERHGGHVYIVCEPLDGETLELALARRCPFGLEETRRVLAGAGFGLEAAHSVGVAHGDIRPANILLTAAGEAKLVDFGLVPPAQRPDGWATRPQSWPSSAYAAPERDRQGPSPAGDFYALAVCGYQMLCGAVPFPGPDFQAQKHAMGYRPVSQAAPGLPARLDRWLEKALQPDPRRRFASAVEFVRALELA